MGITVEGANILTRSLIVFGQGAIRAHPYLMQEVVALGQSDQAAGQDAFDAIVWKHLGHSVRNMFRAMGMAWDECAGGLGAARRGARRLLATGAWAVTPRRSRLFPRPRCSLWAARSSVAKMLSARLGDVLAELYLLSAVLRRWQDEGRHEADLPLVRCCMEQGLRHDRKDAWTRSC